MGFLCGLCVEVSILYLFKECFKRKSFLETWRLPVYILERAKKRIIQNGPKKAGLCDSQKIMVCYFNLLLCSVFLLKLI